MSVKLNSSGGGSITLQEPSTASNRTLTLPDNTGNLISSADSGTITQGMLASGVAGTGPAFSAYLSANLTLSNNTWTKYLANIEIFDTNNCYDTSLCRFTPNVAGYYWCSGVASSSSGATGYVVMALYKNGSAYNQFNYSAVTSNFVNTSGGGVLLYMNGTTDYAEWYINQSTGGSLTYNAGSLLSMISANMVRAA